MKKNTKLGLLVLILAVMSGSLGSIILNNYFIGNNLLLRFAYIMLLILCSIMLGMCEQERHKSKEKVKNET